MIVFEFEVYNLKLPQGKCSGLFEFTLGLSPTIYKIPWIILISENWEKSSKFWQNPLSLTILLLFPKFIYLKNNLTYEQFKKN